MATKNYQVVSPSAGDSVPPGTLVVQWLAMNNGDDGEPFVCPMYPDKSVQVWGAYGAAGACTIKGCLSPSANNAVYGDLEDGSGNLLAFNAAKGNGAVDTVQPTVWAVRPVVSGGDNNTSLNCLLLLSTVARR